MKQAFMKMWESTGDVCKAVNAQIQEDRFLGYAKILQNNSEIVSLAKKGCEKSLASYIKDHNTTLNIPVRLTDRGIRRMATHLVTLYKKGV